MFMVPLNVAYGYWQRNIDVLFLSANSGAGGFVWKDRSEMNWRLFWRTIRSFG